MVIFPCSHRRHNKLVSALSIDHRQQHCTAKSAQGSRIVPANKVLQLHAAINGSEYKKMSFLLLERAEAVECRCFL
jgi:hypothetical protein